ncbi:prostate stem cell antigen-like [Bufo gargarizans]|uniref:prostate stem cell antigen-like n=1 Tax=Bufo gargarizans TaxID=30331 RepID=UPI001CF3D0BE|nr:prostate stem cell antigen-like [Bufo gargarizans]
MALSDSPCKQDVNCSGATPFCGTNKINGVVMTYISKFCSAACITASGNFTVVSVTESCCKSDLCNNETIGDVNSIILWSGSSGLTGGAFLLVAISGLLSAIFAM